MFTLANLKQVLKDRDFDDGSDRAARIYVKIANLANAALREAGDWDFDKAYTDLAFQAYYTTGTVSVAADGTTVTGVGTTFTRAMVGQYFRFNGEDLQYLITGFTDATHLTIENYAGETDLSAVTYEITDDRQALPARFRNYAWPAMNYRPVPRLLPEKLEVIRSWRKLYRQISFPWYYATEWSDVVLPYYSASRAVASNVATLTLLKPHNLAPGESVTVAGMGTGALNGTFTIIDTPGLRSFTYAAVTGDQATTADTAGTITPERRKRPYMWIYPSTSEKRVLTVPYFSWPKEMVSDTDDAGLPNVAAETVLQEFAVAYLYQVQRKPDEYAQQLALAKQKAEESLAQFRSQVERRSRQEWTPESENGLLTKPTPWPSLAPGEPRFI
jgi:hypothetical protein